MFLITHGTKWPILRRCATKQLLTHSRDKVMKYLAGVDGVLAALADAAAAAAFARFFDPLGLVGGGAAAAAGTSCDCSRLAASSHQHQLQITQKKITN